MRVCWFCKLKKYDYFKLVGWKVKIVEWNLFVFVFDYVCCVLFNGMVNMDNCV